MNIFFSYMVIEHYDDEAPEPFGWYDSKELVEVGQVIQLKWLNGSLAHKVKVLDVNNDTMRLTVRKHEEETVKCTN